MSFLVAPNASIERVSKSSDTDGSPASILVDRVVKPPLDLDEGAVLAAV